MSVRARMTSDDSSGSWRSSSVLTRPFSKARIPIDSWAYAGPRLRLENGPNQGQKFAIVALLAHLPCYGVEAPDHWLRMRPIFQVLYRHLVTHDEVVKEYGLLRPKMVEDSAASDARSLGDLIKRGLSEATIYEQLEGRFGNAGSRLLRLTIS